MDVRGRSEYDELKVVRSKRKPIIGLVVRRFLPCIRYVRRSCELTSIDLGFGRWESH